MATRKCMLVVLDGWGHSEETRYNAIAAARKPNFDRISKGNPHTLLIASGMDVGLPRGLMGNSEVGHLNLGAGRIVWQEITRISKSIEDGDFFLNPAFTGAMDKALASGGKLHLMGLVSDGGVHSWELHYMTLVEMAAKRGFKGDRLVVHPITDGRDTPPTSGLGHVRRLSERLEQTGAGVIGSVCGRYFAMDRDKRWDRLEKAYRAYTEGEAAKVESPLAGIEASYAAGVTDEFLLPMAVTRGGRPIGLIGDGDSVIFFNFRADRAREITSAFTDPSFPNFPRKAFPKVNWVCMTRYDSSIKAAVAFPPQSLNNVLGEHLSSLGLTQLRIAETEKYAHVTYFFNGGREEPFPLEERMLVPSPKVPTYDQMPQMSAAEVTSKLLDRLSRGAPDFVLLNFANPDMVGHTGVFDAAVKAVETVDGCLGAVANAFLALGGAVMVTADHGNAELMFDEQTNEPHTAHTTNPVPFILAGAGPGVAGLRAGGRLCDVAPTICSVMGLRAPSEMEGESLA